MLSVYLDTVLESDTRRSALVPEGKLWFGLCKSFVSLKQCTKDPRDETLLFSAPHMANGLAGAVASVSSSDSYPSTSPTVNCDFGIRTRLSALVK